MAQGGGGKKRQNVMRKKSAGSTRKSNGHASKHLKPMRADYLRDKAGKSFIGAIENDMATRVPSDQRSKLTLLRATGPVTANRKQGKKKPLTRGRRRKNSKGEK